MRGSIGSITRDLIYGTASFSPKTGLWHHSVGNGANGSDQEARGAAVNGRNIPALTASKSKQPSDVTARGNSSSLSIGMTIYEQLEDVSFANGYNGQGNAATAEADLDSCYTSAVSHNNVDKVYQEVQRLHSVNLDDQVDVGGSLIAEWLRRNSLESGSESEVMCQRGMAAPSL